MAKLTLRMAKRNCQSVVRNKRGLAVQNRKYRFFTCVCVTMWLAGCTASNTDIGLWGAGNTRFEEQRKLSLASATLAFDTSRRSHDTLAYLLNQAKRPAKQCSTSKNNEVKQTVARQVTYDSLFKYMAAISQNFEDSGKLPQFLEVLTSDDPYADISKVDDLLNLGIHNVYAVAARTFLTTAAEIVRTAQQESARLAIIRQARANQSKVESMVEDFKAGFKSLNVEINANLKLWEQCEFEKLWHFKNNHQHTPMELERRYIEFWNQRAAIAKLGNFDTKQEEVIDRIKCLHAGLTGGKNCKENSSIDELRQETKRVLDTMKSIRDALRYAEGALGLLNQPVPPPKS
jgi:hypothetical protein